MNVNSHGIGLSFCKRVAKSLGGDLILNEKIRDGCEFVLNITLKKLDALAKVRSKNLWMYFSNKKIRTVDLVENFGRWSSKSLLKKI